VAAIHAEIWQLVPPTPAFGFESVAPKLIPDKVMLTPAEFGMLVAPAAKVTAGASYVNARIKVPLTPSSESRIGKAAPAPCSIWHLTAVFDTKVVAWHSVTPIRTEGLKFETPKFTPETVTAPPAESGIFRGATRVSAGESYENALDKEPTVEDTVALTACRLPEPTGFKHRMLESVTHCVPWQEVTPTCTDVVKSSMPKLFPSNVMTAPPETGPFGCDSTVTTELS